MTAVFYESWNERRFRSDLIAAGVATAEAEAIQFRQDNHSRSSRCAPGLISSSPTPRASCCAAVLAQS